MPGISRISTTSLDGFSNAPPIIGARIGYAYNSFIGPLAFNLFWSNHTRKVGAFISIGHAF